MDGFKVPDYHPTGLQGNERFVQRCFGSATVRTIFLKSMSIETIEEQVDSLLEFTMMIRRFGVREQ